MSAPATPDLITALHEIKERAEAATAGPWRTEPNTFAGRVWVQIAAWRTRPADCEPLFKVRSMSGTPTPEDYRQREADAAFIAAARSDVPRLLAAVDAALKLMADWKDAADQLDAEAERRTSVAATVVLSARAQTRDDCSSALRKALTRALAGEPA